jgi:hypothetical protein
MKETIKYKLPFVKDDGTDGEYEFSIKFVSNRIVFDYNELNRSIKTVQEKWILLNRKQKELEAGKIKDFTAFQAEIEKIQMEIADVADKSFFDKRFDLLKRLLTQNGYSEGEFLTYDFWWNNVQPKDIIEFLQAAVLKDLPKK